MPSRADAEGGKQPGKFPLRHDKGLGPIAPPANPEPGWVRRFADDPHQCRVRGGLSELIIEPRPAWRRARPSTGSTVAVVMRVAAAFWFLARAHRAARSTEIACSRLRDALSHKIMSLTSGLDGFVLNKMALAHGASSAEEWWLSRSERPRLPAPLSAAVEMPPTLPVAVMLSVAPPPLSVTLR